MTSASFPQIPLPFGDFNPDDPNAQILSRLVCIYTWRKYKAWVDLESVQFSPLSGKILFKNLRYHSRNQSFVVLRGHITFRYWLPRVRKEADADQPGQRDLRCRIKLRLDGMEWFFYNRTPAYEYLDSVLQQWQSRSPSAQFGSRRGSQDNFTINIESEELKNEDKDRGFRKMLPIEITGTQGSIILGNPDLPSILIFYYKEANGTYDSVKYPLNR
ncbi:hypothetical protein BDK51DRAFT_33607, partial [Blyttiomyces helicus]